MGNYKAIVSYPQKKGKLPVIIYNYDEYYDWAGKKLANKQGYSLENFAKEFNRWGFICIIPLERYRKLGALKGAIEYAKNLKRAKKNDIHIIGLSEGAFLSMLSTDNMPKIRSMTLLAPKSINYTGHFSLPQVIRQIKKFTPSILFIVGSNEKNWRLRLSKTLHRILVENKNRIKYIEYPCTKKWFFNQDNLFMHEIYRFITRGKSITDLEDER